jgi:uncharacterized protein
MANLYPFVLQMRTMLANLDRWLGDATEYATTRKFDPEVFVNARLAPDQYPLSRQVQAAADAAKLGAARLAGRAAPVHEDSEKTLADLRARARTVITYIETFSEQDFEGAEARKVPLPFLPGGTKGALGVDYFVRFAQPNFFFHVNHAYAILRHNGVALGKMPYLGEMPPLLDM